MSTAIVWSPEADATILHLRAGGLPWHAVASQLGLGRNSVIERARRIGLPAAVVRRAAEPSPEPARDDRLPLPPGHPVTWQAITDRTSLEGMPYPFPVFL